MNASPIKKVAVIGSGVMGSQIAAHITNAGIPVFLFDIVPKSAQDRNVLANGALARMQKDGSPFMHPDNAKLIATGNLEDDIGKVAEADWIIEAVLEDIQIKSALYKKIDTVRKQGTFVSSNTSTIPLNRLIEGQSDSFARDFLITHFFNPPRQMRLLELVVGEKTSPEAARVIGDFCDRSLGKGVVRCKDTPGFIANRLGIYFLQTATQAAFDLGLDVEEADAVFGKPMGMPKTGIFGLIDLIGLDLMSLILKNFLSMLPKDDPYFTVSTPRSVIEKMIADGYTGRKGKGGFYRIKMTETGKVIEGLDLKTGEYRATKEVKPKSVENSVGSIKSLCEAQDNVGKFAWSVLSQTLAYAATLVPQAAGDIASVDAAMRLGFNWQFGPFELMDKLGAAWFAEKLRAEGRAVPDILQKAEKASFYKIGNGKLEYLTVEGQFKPIERSEGVLLLADIKRAAKPVLENATASAWDIGDGVLCFEFHTKMNTLEMDTFVLLKETVALIENNNDKYKGLVIYNEGSLFSAGANLSKGLLVKDAATFEATRQLIRQGQKTYSILRFASFPSVSAPAGLALGGACELTLHCAAAQAYAETSIGLVEFLVGLVPGWGGCTQTLGRAFEQFDSSDPLVPIRKVFDIISHARRSASAFDARDILYLRRTDGITMNRERLLFDAKQRVLALAKNYKPPKPLKLNLPKAAGYAVMEKEIENKRASGQALPHDVTVMKSLAAVLCGLKQNQAQPVTEPQMLALEEREFMKLEETQETAARIEYMLKTGKPLKN